MSLSDKFVDFSNGHPLKPNKKVKSRDDLRYINSVSSAVLLHSRWEVRLLLWVGFLAVVWAIVWAYFAKIDQLTRGSGKVIPSSQLQVVQNLEGGIVSEIRVKAGDQVQQGDVLIKIDDTGLLSSYAENQLRYRELQAKSVRLAAEANGEPFVAKEPLRLSAPELYRDEESLYLSNRAQLDNSMKILTLQWQQKQQELTEIQAKQRHLQTSFQLITREMEINAPLVDQGVVTEIEFLRLQRQANDIDGELQAANLLIPRLGNMVQESNDKIAEARLAFQAKAKLEYNEAVAEMARIEQTNIARQDMVQRTQVRAPMDGTVKQVLVNTIGGIIQPGSDIVEIVPEQNGLQVEARVRPADIAFLYPGQSVIVKFSAYDFAIYGSMQGELTHIAADTVIDEQSGESFYHVTVKTAQRHLGDDPDKLQIRVGMMADIDVMTGKQTVLDYILKPILRAKQNALSER